MEIEFNDYKEHDSKLIPGSFSSLKDTLNTNNYLTCFNLKDFIKGWFIGDFEPSIFNTKDFEVAIKYYKKNDIEDEHYHKIAKEWTCVIDGEVKFNNQIFEKDSVILVNPYQKIKFKALEDSTTVVIKIPSVKGDKYII
jgi:hypothetical protein